MNSTENDDKEKILTVNGKSFTSEVEEDRKNQLLKVRAELDALFQSGKIDSVEYNRRIVELEVPDEYKNQRRISRKRRRFLLFSLIIIIVLAAIPGIVYVGFRYYFQNTLTAENIELDISEDRDEQANSGESETSDDQESSEKPEDDAESIDIRKSSLENGPVQMRTIKTVENGEYKNRSISVTYKDYYDITGIVTSVHDFWGFDDYSVLVPRDVCLVWGSLADTFLNGGVEFHQAFRYCAGRISGDLSEPVESFIFKTPFGQTRSSLALMSNNHLIASTIEIRNQILGLKAKDEIRIEGYLVDVIYGGIGLNSSERRDDTGNGACEIIYVTNLENHGQKNNNT